MLHSKLWLVEYFLTLSPPQTTHTLYYFTTLPILTNSHTWD